MVNSIYIPFLIAIFSSFIWSLMNVLDKYIISHKVKNIFSFAIIAGALNLFIGLILALFLNWNNINLIDLLFPVLVGIIAGSQFFVYYLILQKEDISKVIGLIYFYPVIVAFLSFLFLNERLSLISYVGVSLILLGALLLSINKRKLILNISLWMILLLIFMIGLQEFFIKIATDNLSILNGVSITSIFIGLVIMFGLFNKKTRLDLKFELKNIKWACFSEILTFLGIFTVYISMLYLPATIVSSIGAVQPLFVLFLESFLNKRGLLLTLEKFSLKKVMSILLIVLGVFLLYLPEVLFLN